MAEPDRPDRFLAISRRLDRLEADVIAPLASTVDLLTRRMTGERDEEAEAPKVPGHKPWKCEGCRSMLGMYDEKRDVLRIRVKDYHVQIRVGQGGWTEVGCRRCGHPNRLEATPGGG